MSFQYMAHAIKQKDLSTTEKFVLVMLANYADDKGRCFPAISTISENCSCSENTARKAIKSLNEKNIIFIEHRFRDDGSQASNIYHLYPHNNMIGGGIKYAPPPNKCEGGGGANSEEGEASNSAPPPYQKLHPFNLSNDTINNEPIKDICPSPKKKQNKYSDDFEEFWQQYPKKAGKPKAFEAYKHAIKRASHSQIMQGVMIYAAENKDPQYIKHPQGWLNDDRWEDKPVQQLNASGSSSKPASKQNLNDQQREAARRFEESMERKYGKDPIY